MLCKKFHNAPTLKNLNQTCTNWLFNATHSKLSTFGETRI